MCYNQLHQLCYELYLAVVINFVSHETRIARNRLGDFRISKSYIAQNRKNKKTCVLEQNAV